MTQGRIPGLAAVALAAALATSGLTGCGGAGATGGAVEVVDEATARAALGRRVSIEGDAGNGKISVVVMRDDLMVYCLDQRWKDELRGRRVRVRGLLEVTDQLQAREENGNITQGTNGDDLVIRRCQID